MEDSKNFPKFTLTDSDSPSNTLTASLTKSNGFVLDVSTLSGKLTMEYPTGNILYVWQIAKDVTIGDLLEKLELYTQLYIIYLYYYEYRKFNTDKATSDLISKLTSGDILTLEGVLYIYLYYN